MKHVVRRELYLASIPKRLTLVCDVDTLRATFTATSDHGEWPVVVYDYQFRR